MSYLMLGAVAMAFFIAGFLVGARVASRQFNRIIASDRRAELWRNWKV